MEVRGWGFKFSCIGWGVQNTCTNYSILIWIGCYTGGKKTMYFQAVTMYDFKLSSPYTKLHKDQHIWYFCIIRVNITDSVVLWTDDKSLVIRVIVLDVKLPVFTLRWVQPSEIYFHNLQEQVFPVFKPGNLVLETSVSGHEETLMSDISVLTFFIYFVLVQCLLKPPLFLCIIIYSFLLLLLFFLPGTAWALREGHSH